MRHRKAGRKFGMKPSHHKSMFRNMARSLVTYERIRTTEARAKELSKTADKLVTLALKNDLHARRQAYKVLENHQLVKKLFDEIGPRFKGISGGFTRVVKLGRPRAGDAAALAVIEFSVLAGEAAPEPAKKAKKAAPKKAAPKKAEEVKAEEPKAEEPKAEEPKAEEPKTEAAPEAEEPKADEPAAEAAEEAKAGEGSEDKSKE